MLPLINNALKYVVIASCVKSNQMHDAIEEYCNSNQIWFIKCGDVQSARANIEAMVNAKAENELGFVLFDDFSAMVGNPGRSNDPYTITIAKSFSMLRNYGIIMVCISQFWFNVPQRVTTSANILFIFSSSSIYSLMGVQASTSTIFMGRAWNFMDAYKEYIDSRSPYNYFIITTNPPRITCVDFSGGKEGKLVDVIAEMDKKRQKNESGGSSSLDKGAGTRDERVDGELQAGNNAVELHIAKLASIARKRGPNAERARSLAILAARNGGIDDDTLERLMHGGL
jgi:hypothetical protein